MSVYVIAEIGINHNGDIKIAKELIDVAADAGCDAVKFQKRNIDLVYFKEYLDSHRESPWGNTQRDQKAGLEFGQDEYEQIDIHCDKRKIDWFASAWDLDSLKFLEQFNCPRNKIASALLSKKELLYAVASQKKHTFISTAMHDMDDILEASCIFTEENCPYELMHCVGTYPMKDEDANLLAIEILKRYSNNVGYSGHETGLQISLAAVAMDATSIERHITLDRTMYGSDQAASLEPEGLRKLVRDIRIIEKAKDISPQCVVEKERENLEKLRVAW